MGFLARWLTALCVLCVAMYVGCHRVGTPASGDTAAAAETPAVVTLDSVRVLALGDSNGAAEDGWVAQLRTLAPALRVYNASVPGNTVGFDNLDNPRLNTLRQLERYLTDARAELGAAPDVAIVALGTNDAKAVFAAREPEVLRKLDSLLAGLRQNGLRHILLVTPPPMGADARLAGKYQGGAERVAGFAEAYRKTAAERNLCLADVHPTLLDDFDAHSRDGVHLDATLQRRTAATILAALRACLTDPNAD